MVETRDALGNRVTVDANDYRVLQPRLVSDPNRNRTEVAFDALGMVVGTAVMGKPLPRRWKATRSTGFVADLTQAAARRLLRRRRPARQRAGAAATTPPRASSTTSTASGARSRRTRRPDEVAARLRRDARPRDPRQRPAAAAGPEDPAQLLLLRRLRPRDPEEDPGRARAARRRRADGQPALGRQRLDHLQQQGQAGPPVRAVLQRHAPLRVRRAASASARSCSTTRSSASSPRCTRTTPTRRWCSTRGSRRPTTSTTPARRATHRPATRAPTPTSAGYVARVLRRRQPADLADLARAAHRRRARRRTSATPPQRAAAHADTPTTAHFDALGRPFLTVAHNRVVCAGHDLDGTEDSFATRVELDIEGNQRAVRDADRAGRRPARPHRHALRLRHARQPHPPAQHGGRRALDAERRGRQAHPRLGQPRPQLHHHLRRAAPPGRADRARHHRGLRPAHAEPRHPGRQDRVRRTAAMRQRQERAQRSTCAPASTGTSIPPASPPTRGSTPTATRSKPTTSRATCCAARAAWSATTRPSPTGC